MKDIGVRIRERRKRLRWTIQKLATLSEIDNGFLSKIENGKSTGSWETYQKLADAMGVPIDALVIGRSNVQDSPLGWREIPVLDYVQAGRWTGVDFELGDEEMRPKIMTDLEHPPSAFAMELRGNSMEPEFREGDKVVIDPTILPKPGDYVVATEEDGEATFKQYRSAGRNEHGQDVFELHPLNPLYGPMRSDRQQISIVGVMVEHRRYRRR